MKIHIAIWLSLCWVACAIPLPDANMEPEDLVERKTPLEKTINKTLETAVHILAIPARSVSLETEVEERDKGPLEGALGGIGKGLDTALDSTLKPVDEAEEKAVKTLEPIVPPNTRSILAERAPASVPEPSKKMKKAMHQLANVIREERRTALEKRDWIDDVLLIVQQLEPLVLPLISAA